jgi:hypothetical protein
MTPAPTFETLQRGLFDLIGRMIEHYETAIYYEEQRKLATIREDEELCTRWTVEYATKFEVLERALREDFGYPWDSINTHLKAAKVRVLKAIEEERAAA